MRLQPSILLWSALVASSLAQGQGGMPYCVWQDPDDDQYHFARLDASDGSLTTIAPLLGLDAFVAGNKTTYNANEDHYHFAGLDIPTVRYYTIEALTGSVLSQPEMTDNIVGIEYDCKESRHYGLREIEDVYDLVEIDPLTAVATSITPVTNLQGYVAESFNFDPRHGYYTFVAYLGGSEYSLRTYHVFSGTLVFDIPFEDHYVAPEYNCPDSSIYALWEDQEVYKLERVQVDGSHTTVSVLEGITPGFVLESSSMSQEGIYTYRGFNADNAFALISIDVATGTVVHNTATTDNAVGFEEPLCCGQIPTAIADVEVPNTMSLFPQPALDHVTIQLAFPMQEIHVFDLTGSVVHRVGLDTGSRSSTVDLSTVPSGTYLIEVLGLDDRSIRRPLVIAR